MKPPPAVITAGGVDMARAYANGIRVRNNNSPDIPLDEPRVVLAVETNPHKVPTHRRLAASRASRPEASDEATLMSPSTRARSGADAAKKPLPNWARAAIVVVSVALVAGLAWRARTWIAPPPPAVAMQAVAPPIELPAIEAPPTAPREPPAAAPPPAPTPSAKPPAPPKPASRVANAARRARPAPAAPAKRGFTPPFELPGEKR